MASLSAASPPFLSFSLSPPSPLHFSRPLLSSSSPALPFPLSASSLPSPTAIHIDSCPAASPPPYLSDLFSLLSSSPHVPSSLKPRLHTLSIHDWRALVSRFADTDWKISWEILSFFRDELPLLDLGVLRRRIHANGAPREPQLLHGDNQCDAEEMKVEVTESESSRTGSSNPHHEKAALMHDLHATLLKALLKSRRFEEVDQLLLLMKEAAVERNASFYNALLDSYADACLTEKAAEVLQDMKAEGIEPRQFLHEKIAHVQMKHAQSTGDLELPKQIIRDLTEKGLKVNVAVFRNLLTAFWGLRDVEGVEETFQSMLSAGHIPNSKDLLKVMQLHGRKGNYERIVELIENMSKWEIQPNAGVYDYLIHAYCKAGLMDKAKETFLKFETAGMKPTPLSLNMLVDGYGKQRLHKEALETFETIRKNGYRPTAVSYSSIISAMVLAEEFNKADELYRKMLRQKIQPNLHTYITMIRCYTKQNFTRDGHKVYIAMRKAPFQMTDAAYGAALVLYIQGNWYSNAAALLKEVENEGAALDAAAQGALIESFSILENGLTPLAKVVQQSDLELCKLLACLLLNNGENNKHDNQLTDALIFFLDKWRDNDSLDDTTIIYNAWMNCLWKKGYKALVKKILSMAREAYASNSRLQLHETEWVLDISRLSAGGAMAAIFDSINSIGDSKVNDNSKVVISGDEPMIQYKRVVKQVLKALDDLGSPFTLEGDSVKLVANTVDVLNWISQDDTKNVMSLC